MKSLHEIIETIKDVISEEHQGKKVFDKDVASALGITQMYFATMKRRDKIPYAELLDFCAKRSLSINWLLYNQSPESLIDATNHYHVVRYFSDVSASAGGGAYNEQEGYEPMVLATNIVTELGGEQELKFIDAIHVTGDSMEPTFSYGDIIFLHRNRCDIGRGGIFTINTEHGLFIKRLQKRIDGKIDIISDNKDYPIQIALPDEMTIVGRVIGRFGYVE